MGDKITLSVEIDVEKDTYCIINYYNGKRDEIYAQSSREKALVYMVSLMCDFRPPRDLSYRDIPFDRTPPEKADVRCPMCLELSGDKNQDQKS